MNKFVEFINDVTEKGQGKPGAFFRKEGSRFIQEAGIRHAGFGFEVKSRSESSLCRGIVGGSDRHYGQRSR